MRRAATDMLKGHESTLAAVAGVIEGTGFRSALTRSVLVGFQFVHPRFSVPVKLFATVPAAMRWLRDRECVADADAGTVGVEEMRKMMDAREQQTTSRASTDSGVAFRSVAESLRVSARR
jgi:hypothetical protein